MQEEGVDLRDRVPRLLNDDLARWADIVVTMGCGDACPVIPGRRYIDWDLTDPKDMPVADVRRIRDDIKTRVASLVEELENQKG
jgi:protein-tyrosine-phosphatase